LRSYVVGIHQADLTGSVGVGSEFAVDWVGINDPERAHSPGTTDGLGVYIQGFEQGGATFRRLEGAWFSEKRVYIVSTSGGDAGEGQVWEYDPKRERLQLLFESIDEMTLDNPDNITLSRKRGILLCEDGDLTGQRLIGITPRGEAFPFAQNDVMLNGEKNGIVGDFRDKEWAGATFSPDGEWLFVNIQTPGITFAITGPWSRGRSKSHRTTLRREHSRPSP
jgi:secreted PhoX family phosphatase